MDDREDVIATLDPAEVNSSPSAAPSPGTRVRARSARPRSRPGKARRSSRRPSRESLVLVGWLIHLAEGPPMLGEACADAAILSGAFYFGRKALSDLVSHHVVGFYFLMSAAAVVSALIGHAQEGAILVFLTSISEAAQDFTEWKTRSAIHALMDLTPKTALVERGDHAEEIAVEELALGDVFIVKPGEAIATDGVVVEGTSDVNQAPITGESQPVTKAPGDGVFAASLNGPAALKVRATKTFADNTVARIIQMVQEAQETKGTSQRFIERFGARYSPVVVLAAPGHRRAPAPVLARRLDDLDQPGDGADGGRIAVRGDDLDSGHAGRRPGHRCQEGGADQGRGLPGADGGDQGGGLRQDGDADLRRAGGDRRPAESHPPRRLPGDRRRTPRGRGGHRAAQRASAGPGDRRPCRDA